MNEEKHIDMIPVPYRKIFSNFVCFNPVQSQVLDDVLYSNGSLVISSPTGSGKTVIFELAIVKLLLDYQNYNDQDFKIVYISPIKSLCQERLIDWNSKFSEFNINCICVTGDSEDISYHQLTNHNLIISTPEKWDVLTRKWKDNETLVKVVKLFMIDEVHLLNEDDRGSTLEVIVSRMKTVQYSIPKNEIGDFPIRFMAVSATICNIEDIAEWMDCSKFFHFPEEFRPVQLKTMILGYNSQCHSSPFKFELSLNYRLQSLIVQHSEGQPTLIFCSTRKSVELTAKHLVQTLKIQINSVQLQKLQEISNSICDIKIKDIVKHGIGIHHAGIDTYSRHIVETIFREGHLPILVATSTLAMGVNLPAHLVIIKSTKHYSNGTYQDYSATAIHQMIGRAGRPQFDTNATALILTTNESKKKIERQLSSNEPVESNLHKHLTEHLNAEVVLGTITGLDVAMQWLASTFLYIRAKKNPRYYGLPPACRQDQLDKKLLEMFQIDLNKLIRVGMITMDDKINIKPTITGQLMARYYVDFETMKMFTQITGNEVFIQILALISKSQEFSETRLRVNDKKTLNLLNRNAKKQTIRFPLNGKIKTWDMKVNCIIQAVLGNLELTDSSIQTESYTILRSGQRIIKCLIDYLSTRKNNSYNALLNSIILGKCLQAKLWENSPFVSKQLSGIGSVFATQLANAEKTTFESILESNPRDIEMIIKRKPPFGNYLIDEVLYIPRFSMSLEQYNQGLKLIINLENVDDLRKKCTLQLSSIMSLLVGNNLNDILVYERYQISYTIENPEIIKYVNLKSAKNLHFVEAHFVSEDWVGIDRFCEVRFQSENNYSDPPEKSNTVEESFPAKPTYIQTFLDMYVKMRKPEKHGKSENNTKSLVKETDNSRQPKLKQKHEKKKGLKDKPENDRIKYLYDKLMNNKIDNASNTDKSTKSLDINKGTTDNEQISFANNLSDSELDILEDHKIITAYKNTEPTNVDGKEQENLKKENTDNISLKDPEGTMENEEFLYSNGDVQDYEEIVSCTSGVEENDVLFDPVPQEYHDKHHINSADNDKEEGKESNNLKSNSNPTDTKELYDISTQELEEIFINSDPITCTDNENVINNDDSEKKSKENENDDTLQEVKKHVSVFDSLTHTDRTLFLISHKYLTDIDSDESIPIKNNSSKNTTLRNILNFRGRKKRKSDDMHPAEELEEQINLSNRQEQENNNIVNAFKKPPKKKLTHNTSNHFYNSSSNNHPYKITEILEPDPRHLKNSEYYLENKKSISWRNPLIFSPGMKFSPKANYKHLSKETIESEFHDGYDESFDSLSSPSKHSKYIQKTPRISKSGHHFKPLMPVKQTFPLSDKDYKYSAETQNSRDSDNIDSLADLCSTELLESLPKKSSNKSDTPRVFKQNNPKSASDYYSQLIPKHMTPKHSKKEMKRYLNYSDNISEKENVEDQENIEEELLTPKRSRGDLNSSQYIVELDRGTKLSQSQDLFPSPSSSSIFDQSTKDARTRSEQYIESKINENYPVYPDFGASTSGRNLAPLPTGREYVEYDTENGLYQNFRSVARSAPKTSMHYSRYVDPVLFGYHPTYGQYVESCCEYPTETIQRNLPAGYVECDVRPNMSQYSTNVETICPSSYQNELSQQMIPSQRRISQERYLTNRQTLSASNPVMSSHAIYSEPTGQDLNSSFTIRNPSYVNYQDPNYTYPVPYEPNISNARYVRYYPREHHRPYGYVPKNSTYPNIDKDYVMNKYWNSINSQK